MAKRTYSYDTEIAELVGQKAAMIFDFIKYWSERSGESHEGSLWIFQPIKSFREQFPTFSESSIKRYLKKLEECHLIVTGNYNKIPFDKTKWYAVNYDTFDKVKMTSSSSSKWSDDEVKMTSSQQVKMTSSQQVKMTSPITNHNNHNNRNTQTIKSRDNRFAPPSIEEVRAYCFERGNNVSPEQFINFYQSKGWMVGKSKMKDWKAAVRTWENRQRSEPKSKPTSSGNPFTDLKKELGYE